MFVRLDIFCVLMVLAEACISVGFR